MEGFFSISKYFITIPDKLTLPFRLAAEKLVVNLKPIANLITSFYLIKPQQYYR
ncbi:hypothetical protein QF042_001395 [Pedobacter sp. W3I1]|nr:hypothetical protein [Pedobacter sp. W3I1]